MDRVDDAHEPTFPIGSGPRLGELVVRCSDHPRFTGERHSRVDCAACRWIYERHGHWIRSERLGLQVGGPT